MNIMMNASIAHSKPITSISLVDDSFLTITAFTSSITFAKEGRTHYKASGSEFVHYFSDIHPTDKLMHHSNKINGHY